MTAPPGAPCPPCASPAGRPGPRRLTTVDAANRDPLPVDRAAISEELEAARSRPHALLGQADAADLRRRTNGTAWTNEQLLFHMVFGFLIVRVLVRPGSASSAGSRRGWSDGWAGLLDSARRPFHAVNYWGARGGAGWSRTTTGWGACATTRSRRCNAAWPGSGRRTWTGAWPTRRWDPYFRPYMTLADIYRYPTLHFEHHRAQLTLRPHPGAPGAPRGSRT